MQKTFSQSTTTPAAERVVNVIIFDIGGTLLNEYSNKPNQNVWDTFHALIQMEMDGKLQTPVRIYTGGEPAFMQNMLLDAGMDRMLAFSLNEKSVLRKMKPTVRILIDDKTAEEQGFKAETHILPKDVTLEKVLEILGLNPDGSPATKLTSQDPAPK